MKSRNNKILHVSTLAFRPYYHHLASEPRTEKILHMVSIWSHRVVEITGNVLLQDLKPRCQLAARLHHPRIVDFESVCRACPFPLFVKVVPRRLAVIKVRERVENVMWVLR